VPVAEVATLVTESGEVVPVLVVQNAEVEGTASTDEDVQQVIQQATLVTETGEVFPVVVVVPETITTVRRRRR